MPTWTPLPLPIRRPHSMSYCVIEPCRRTVMTYGEPLLRSIDFPRMLFARYDSPTRIDEVGYLLFSFRLVEHEATDPWHSLVRPLHGYNFGPSGGTCLGRRATSLIESGELDPVDAFWMTTFTDCEPMLSGGDVFTLGWIMPA